MDISNSQFGDLIVIHILGPDIKGRTLWECACKCGSTVVAREDQLLSGNLQSCEHCSLAPWKGPDTYTNTGSAAILGYKAERDHGAFNGHPRRELLILEQAMDHGGFTRNEWSWMYRRWNTLHERVYKPSARFKVMGTAPGRAPARAAADIQLFKCVQDIQEVLEAEI